MERLSIVYGLSSLIFFAIALYLAVTNTILRKKFGVILTESDLEHFNSKNVFLMLNAVTHDSRSPNVRYYHFAKGKTDNHGVFTPEDWGVSDDEDYPQICFRLSSWSFKGGIGKGYIYQVTYKNVNPDGSEKYILKKFDFTESKTALPYVPSNEIEYDGFEGLRESEFCD